MRSDSPSAPVARCFDGTAPARSLAIVIPCLNEESAISNVVTDYRRAFPDARIVVVDNGSEDRTFELASAAGAEVLSEPIRGKARAILAAFDLLEEPLILMVDGDGSYPAEGGLCLVREYFRTKADLVSGIRCIDPADGPIFRPLHQMGTRVFEKFVWLGFHHHTSDVFSGLRLLTKRFYKNVPILSRGFELEIELTIQAVDKGFRMAEVEVPFRSRTEGGFSKLSTVKDGVRILRALFVLLRDYKPFFFFSRLAGVWFMLGSLAGFLPVMQYLETSQVGRFPLAFLAASLMTLSVLTFFVGLLLESNLRHHRETYQVRLRGIRPSKLEPPSVKSP